MKTKEIQQEGSPFDPQQAKREYLMRENFKKAMSVLETDSSLALSLLKDEVTLCDENGFAHLMIGFIMYNNEDFESALMATEKAMERLSWDNSWLCNCYFLRGRIKLELERENEAIADVKTALNYNPDSKSVYRWLSEYYDSRKEYYEVIKCNKELYRIIHVPEILWCISCTYYDLCDYGRAELFARKAMEGLGANFRNCHGLANILACQARYDEALQEYLKCNFL